MQQSALAEREPVSRAVQIYSLPAEIQKDLSSEGGSYEVRYGVLPGNDGVGVLVAVSRHRKATEQYYEPVGVDYLKRIAQYREVRRLLERDNVKYRLPNHQDELNQVLRQYGQ